MLLHYGRKSHKRSSFLPTFSLPDAGVMGVLAPQIGPGQGGLAVTGAF